MIGGSAIFFCLTSLAVNIAISLEWRIAGANLPVVPCLTPGILSTWLASTERDTGSRASVTSLVIGTVRVLPTAYFLTSDIWIPLEALLADAFCHMEVNLAVCTITTSGGSTRVDTLLGDTGLVKRTIIIDQAFI